MVRARSLGRAPRANKDRTRRSTDTDESPASIFATRDWLDFRRRASSTCERLRRLRHFFRLWLSASRNSTSAASASDRFRKSLASHAPPAWPACCFSSRLPPSTQRVVLPQPTFAGGNDSLERPSCFLAEHLGNYYCVRINPIDDSPSRLGIVYSKFVASRRAALTRYSV